MNEAGAGAPTKIIVRGMDGTPDPTFTNGERRYAAHSTMYALDGWAELPVRAGRYRVIGARGPAFSLSVREVTVEDGAVVEVRDTVRVGSAAEARSDAFLRVGGKGREVLRGERAEGRVGEGFVLVSVD